MNRFAGLLCLLILGMILPLSLVAQDQNEINLANEYYNDGEYEKALELYQRFLNKNAEADFYVYRALDCYLFLEQYEQAREFIGRITKKNKRLPHYEALRGRILEKEGKLDEAQQLWDQIIASVSDLNDFYRLGGLFMSLQKYPYAQKTYEQGRLRLRDDALFTSELAYLYQFSGQFDRSTQEYLSMYLKNNNQLGYVKSQILRMVQDNSREAIERSLLAQVQRNSSDANLLDILYEFYLNTENYREALAQARSIDRLNREGGRRLFKLAQTLQNNKEYDLSDQALQAIIDSYRDSSIQLEAQLERAKNSELKALDAVPVDTVAIRQAVENYNQLFSRNGRVPVLAEAMYRKASLCVFYLNDLKAAAAELEAIEALPMPNLKKADAKLLMGDVLIMQGEYNAAKLKYAEVEEQFANTQTGAKAKYRQAKLSYFKGDFETAKAFLGVLKENTSNDIANDAIRLFLLIQDNTGLDTSTTALQRFADAQLLIYRKRYDEALALLDSIAYAFPNHELQDDIIWEKANILLNQKKIDETIAQLDRILDKYGSGIYADDALFLKAEIYEQVLRDTKVAQDLYFDLLIKFPASLFKVEARKRIRKLRGENIN